MTFDYSGFGASGGDLRQTEIPVRKMAHLATVVDALRSSSTVDHDRIGVLGVCASAQYAHGALACGLPVASFVTVAGWFHDLESVAPFYGGPEGVSEATRQLLDTGVAPTAPASAEEHFARMGR